MSLRLVRGAHALVLILTACGGAIGPPGDSTTEAPPSPPLSPPPSEQPSATAEKPPPLPPAPTSDPDLVALHPGPPGVYCDIDFEQHLGVAGGRIYWVLSCGPPDGPYQLFVASAPVTGGTATVAFQLDAPYSGDIQPFAIGAHVAFQSSGGSAFVIRAGETMPRQLVWSEAPCWSMATDATTVYCLTNSLDPSILAWSIDGAGPTTLFTGIGQGVTDLQVDANYLYLARPGHSKYVAGVGDVSSNDGVIQRLPLASAGGPATFETIVSGQSPTDLTVRGSTLAWGNYGPLAVLASTSGGAGAVSLGADLLKPLVDPADASTIWFFHEAPGGKVPGPHEIRKSSANGSAPTTWKTGLDFRTLFTVDATHVYWSGPAGIYRHAK